jgi:hypothetical protein
MLIEIGLGIGMAYSKFNILNQGLRHSSENAFSLFIGPSLPRVLLGRFVSRQALFTWVARPTGRELRHMEILQIEPFAVRDLIPGFQELLPPIRCRDTKRRRRNFLIWLGAAIVRIDSLRISHDESPSFLAIRARAQDQMIER